MLSLQVVPEDLSGVGVILLLQSGAQDIVSRGADQTGGGIAPDMPEGTVESGLQKTEGICGRVCTQYVHGHRLELPGIVRL